MKRRILQVVTDTDRRGAQVFATDLHRALERVGRTVHTVALAPGKVGGLELPVLGASRLDPRTLRALRSEIKQSKVVLAHGSTTLPACAIAAAYTGVPFVYRQISDSRFWAASRLRRARVRMEMRRAAAVVALWKGSATTLHEYLGVRPSRIHVIPNGVDSSRFPAATSETREAARKAFSLEQERFTVVYVGALAPEKGVDRVVSAAAALPQSQFLIVGDGPERTSLEEAARHDKSPVTFAGAIADPLVAYHAADVVVLPSRGGDSMPAVLIEAGLCQVPCISTDVEAIPEIVIDGSTGRVLEKHHDSELPSALSDMRIDTATRTSMGRAARKHCLAHFDIEVVANAWLEVIDALKVGVRG